MVLFGKVKGKTIVLDEPTGLDDGTEVSVEVVPVPGGTGEKHPLLEVVGLLAGAPEWDEIAKELYKMRQEPNRSVEPL